MFEEKFGSMLKKTVTIDGDILKIGKKFEADINDVQVFYVTEPTFAENGTVYISIDGEINQDLNAFNNQSFNYTKKQTDNLGELVELIGSPVLEGVSSAAMAKQALGDVKADNQERKQEKNALKCPKCGSHEIQFVGNKRKGFSVGKAVGGAVLTGGIGTLAGFAGGKGKKNEFVCMNCGKTFIKKA